MAGHLVRLNHRAPSSSGHIMRMRPRSSGDHPSFPVWCAPMVSGAPAPCRQRVGRPTRRLACGATRLWSIPATAGGPRYDAGALPSRLPMCRDASLGGEPGEEHRVFDAGPAPHMHHWQLARAQEPGKGLRADPQPPLRFGKGDQLRRRGDLQGEVRLPRGRARSGAWASGHGWHGRGFPSQEPGRQHEGAMHPTAPNGAGRSRGDRLQKMC